MRLIRLLLLVGFVVPLAGGCGSGALGSQQTCQQLTDEYTAAYTTALACTPGIAEQCQQQAPALSCDCSAPVEDASTLNVIAAELRAQGCIPSHPYACPCAAFPGPVVCVAADGGGGTCSHEQPSGQGL
jgi:hypothetical protein